MHGSHDTVTLQVGASLIHEVAPDENSRQARVI